MQRWLKLPDGRIIDANRIAHIGKVETYTRYDEEGDDLGIGCSVLIGTDFPRESQLTVAGTKDEILAMLRALLGTATTPAAQ